MIPLKTSTEVVVPTRNRPTKLNRCLIALADAQNETEFNVLVCDSSDDEHHESVRAICAGHSFVTVKRHWGTNVAAARNACARFASGEILINVDDDIRVERDSIRAIVDCYRGSPSPSVIAGSVAWDNKYSQPVVMRYIGYGRSARPGERPSFLIGAFFAYSRSLALALPWNERIRTSDDRFMGALWRSHGVHLGYSPRARATHDSEHVSYSVDEQSSHIYANMFDAVIANPDLRRAVAYQALGFAAGARVFCRTKSGTQRYLAAWLRGNRQLIRDRRFLRELVEREIFV